MSLRLSKKDLDALLGPYNPWWHPGSQWEDSLPDYRRPVVSETLGDLAELPQIISITGPRRVGKSTALKHVISHLIRHDHVDPRRILYFSFDDPALFGSPEMQGILFDCLVERFAAPGHKSYFFLDEIQRLPKWELFLKKHYDLASPIRFVVSGSASSPIFRKSQESLLGRVKDRHLLPFSFREYCEYRLRKQPEFADILRSHAHLRPALLGGNGADAMDCLHSLNEAIEPFQCHIDQAVLDYCREGGFPEVWELHDPVRKIEYLMEQQVRKVLYEDLMVLAQYRKPENVLRLFVYLLGHPGSELNITKMSNDAGVGRHVIEENLPRLEMTDLIFRIQKFSHKPLRVRRGNIKCYPADMALRNAVLKTWEMPDATAMGVYAENLVVRELVGWPEKIEVSYFREKDREVDFVLTHGGARYLPIEVKHRKKPGRQTGLQRFMRRYNLDFGVVITRDRMPVFRDGVLYLPLLHFLLVS